MPIINQNELHKMTAGDADLVADLAIIFVKQLPQLQARIRLGIETHDASELESCAHQLKSRVSYFGATELRQQIEDFEHAAGTQSQGELSDRQSELCTGIEQLIDELRQLTDLELQIEQEPC